MLTWLVITGDFHAALDAVETLDVALKSIVRAIAEMKGLLVITADHGNADQMLIKLQRKNGNQYQAFS